jgi:predicted nucleic acid-binding protein
LVLDASIALAWAYNNENTSGTRLVFEKVLAEGAWVPGLWRLEVANVLEMGVRRARTDAAFRDATLADLLSLPISIDTETNVHAWTETLDLAERHRLTLYDAAYLELAIRRALPLATLDAELISAARTEKIDVLNT